MSDEEGNVSGESPYASPAQRTAYENGRGRWGDECHGCGQRGHWQSECPQRWRGNNMRCIECGSGDHSMQNCPIHLEQQRREREKAARAEREDVEGNVDNEEEDDDERSDNGSEGEDEEN